MSNQTKVVHYYPGKYFSPNKHMFLFSQYTLSHDRGNMLLWTYATSKLKFQTFNIGLFNEIYCAMGTNYVLINY